MTEEAGILTFEQIKQRIADPNYILVKIVKEEPNDGE